MPEPETKTICFRAEPWMVAWIEAQAERERRTVGAMVRVMLERQHSLEAVEGGES